MAVHPSLCASLCDPSASPGFLVLCLLTDVCQCLAPALGWSGEVLCSRRFVPDKRFECTDVPLEEARMS